MKKKDVLKTLNSVRCLKTVIDEQLIILHELQHTKIVASYGVTCSSSSSLSRSKVETAVEKIIEKENALNDNMTALSTAIKNVTVMIDLLSAPLLKAIFIARFLNFLTFEQIAENLSISISHIYRLYDQGLKEIVQKTS